MFVCLPSSRLNNLIKQYVHVILAELRINSMPKVGALYFQNGVHTLFKLPYLHANNNNTKKKGITEICGRIVHV